MLKYKEILQIKTYRFLFCLLSIFYYYFVRNGYADMFNIYEYAGFEYEISVYRLTNSIILFIILLFILLSANYLSSFNWSVAGSIFTMMTIPMLIYYEFNPYTTYSYLFGHISLFLGYILMAQMFPKLQPIKIKKAYNDTILITLLVLMLIPFIFTFGFTFDFNIFLLGEEVYDVRFNSIDKGNLFTAYFEGWLSRAICPILFIYGLLKSSKKIMFFATIGMLYLFLTAAHKSLLLSFFTLFIFHFVKGYEKKIIVYTLTICFLVFLGQLLDFFEIPNGINAIVLYRYLFIPLEVGSLYYDFFSDKFLYWSHSPFNIFGTYPYDLTPSYVIGREYYGNANMGANTGIVAEGFMNLGFMGTLINIIVFTFFMGIWHRLKTNESYFGVVFIYLTAIQNSSMNTILLTHGFLIAIAIFYFFNLNPSDNK